MTHPKHPDSDAHKGAVEEETPRSGPERPYTQGQLGHRTSDAEIKGNDTDFPGPDPHEEHTGEREGG